MIIDHDHVFYRRLWALADSSRYNGAYYYSQEIVQNIIPFIKTDRNWVTINVPGACTNHSIVFIHNNVDMSRYEWLQDFDDLILVCGIPETCEKVKHLGKPVYLPLSIDAELVESFKREQTKDVAYAGRAEKMTDQIPEGTDLITGLPRPILLSKMAQYKKVYAVGRIALEAKALGCEVLPYDPRFPDPDFWELRDNSDVIPMLQDALDKIDAPKKQKIRKKSRNNDNKSQRAGVQRSEAEDREA